MHSTAVSLRESTQKTQRHKTSIIQKKAVAISFLIFLLLASTISLAYAETYVFVAKWGTSGSGDGQFNQPNYVAVDNAGYVYVADNYNDRVQKFSFVPDMVVPESPLGTATAITSIVAAVVAYTGIKRLRKTPTEL